MLWKSPSGYLPTFWQHLTPLPTLSLLTFFSLVLGTYTLSGFLGPLIILGWFLVRAPHPWNAGFPLCSAWALLSLLIPSGEFQAFPWHQLCTSARSPNLSCGADLSPDYHTHIYNWLLDTEVAASFTGISNSSFKSKQQFLAWSAPVLPLLHVSYLSEWWCHLAVVMWEPGWVWSHLDLLFLSIQIIINLSLFRL